MHSRPFRKPSTRAIAHPLALIVLLAVAALTLSPLLSVLRIALGPSDEIWDHILVYVLPIALKETCILLAGVGAVTTIIGVGTARLVTMLQFPGRNAFIWLLPLALAMPIYIVAYIYVDMFDSLGPVSRLSKLIFGPEGDRWIPSLRSRGGAIVVMSLGLYPYVYLAARAAFQMQSPQILQAARILGASGWRLAWHVTLPLARPAIVVGLSLALLEALNDIGASEYLGVRTLTLSIFTTWLNRGSLSGAAQIACLMLLTTALLMAMERHSRRQQQFLVSDRQPRAAPRIALTGAKRWLAFAACGLPVAFGFAIPIGYLIYEVIVRNLIVGFDPSLVNHALNTLVLAGTATLVILVLGFGAAIAARLIAQPAADACLSVASLGYAIPGAVLALGLLSPLVTIDEALNWITRTFAGLQVGLVLAGSGAALVIAYTIRFLTISIGFGQAALTRVPLELDKAASVLGARPARVITIVQLPLIRPALWGAALLVFVDCLKELPATLLLRPLNVETLSTYIYQFATRGSFEEGSLAALLIVAVGIFPIIWMVRHADELSNPWALPLQTRPLPQANRGISPSVSRSIA